jgi:hypothetical protein
MERLHVITDSRRDVLELCLQAMEGAHDQTKRLISSGKHVSDKKPPPGAIIPRDLLGRLAFIIDAFKAERLAQSTFWARFIAPGLFETASLTCLYSCQRWT